MNSVLLFDAERPVRFSFIFCQFYIRMFWWTNIGRYFSLCLISVNLLLFFDRNKLVPVTY